MAWRYMIRTLAWTIAGLAVASAQVASDENRDTEEKPAPVEASAAVRESLADCRAPRILEALPDPVKYPELHAKELEGTRQSYGMVSKIAGYTCYPVDPGYSEDLIQPLLDTLSASANLQATASRERFWPEKMISWGKGDQVRRVALSIRTKEVVFFDGKEQMRYGLTGEAVKRLKSTVGDLRVMRPDALEEAVPLLDAMKQGTGITIHEGIPRFPLKDSGEGVLKRRGEWLIGGFQFLKTGTVARDTKALRDLLLKEGALATWGGGKACGGFHPDFAVTWRVDKQEVSLLVCFGCHEVIFFRPEGTLIYDLPKESYDALKNELERFRPESVPEDK